MGAPDGRPYTVERVVCVFERDLAGPLWRHTERQTGAEEGRRATELVVRSIATLANYDYVFDWVFTRAGEIAVNIGATGIDAVKGVAVRSIADPGAAEATATGALVAPGLVAVNHDHFFSIRLDFDVDGPANRFLRQRVAPVAGPPRSYWRLVEDPMPLEGAVSMTDGPQVWAVENPGRITGLGRHPAYQIVTGGALSLLDPEDWPQRRGAFSGAHLWLTALREGEDFAAGAYPNQSPGGEGLPAYVNGESIEDADLVAWATVGFHHVTRPEDWPILSTLWRGLRLRPYGFFDRNPSLGVRRD
jgi:primary-amine oxidase